MVVVLAVAGFVWSLKFAGAVACRPALLPITAAAGAPCLNGTAGYVPAFVALLAVALGLTAMRHPAWQYLLGASAVLLASLTFRTLDLELCGLTRIASRPIGTHFLWHVLNAATLYLLLLGAIRHGRERA